MDFLPGRRRTGQTALLRAALRTPETNGSPEARGVRASLREDPPWLRRTDDLVEFRDHLFRALLNPADVVLQPLVVNADSMLA